MRHKLASVIGLAILLSASFTFQGCVSTPTGNQPDTARIARIAGAAAFLGGSIDLMQHPDHRPAFALAVELLKSLEDSKNYDAAALAQSLSGLNVRELQGPEGIVYIQVALFVWDEALSTMSAINQKTLVAATLPQIRSGLERALQSTKQ